MSKAHLPLVLWQAMLALTRRPLRTALAAGSVTLAMAAGLVVMGWSASARADVGRTFDRLAATGLRLRDTAPEPKDALFPSDFVTLVDNLDGVRAAGRIGLLASDATAARAHGAGSTQVQLMMADPGFFSAAESDIATGRVFDSGQTDQSKPPVVLGPGAATDLGLSILVPGQAIEVEGRGLTVVGILGSVGGATELQHAVVMPFGAPGWPGAETAAIGASALVRTEVGAASQLASQLPLALRPSAPGRVGVLLPPEAQALRASLDGSMSTLIMGAAGLAVVLASVGVAISLFGAVSQRSAEIGLRRSLGASRGAVATQFVIEGTMLGFAGAVCGTTFGLAALWALASWRGWPPTLPGYLSWATPLIGAGLGALGAIWPSLRAARLEPSDALNKTG